MALSSDQFPQRCFLLFAQGKYREVRDLIEEVLADQQEPQVRELLLRWQGWVELARGETEQAYQLFHDTSYTEGGRAGLLLLTVLAGQVKTALESWWRYLQSLDAPPRDLPDSFWHNSPASRAALDLLERHPLPEKSPLLGSSLVYQALLLRSTGQLSRAFRCLAEAAEFFPLASLLRDAWLEDQACLPAPSGATVTEDTEAPGKHRLGPPPAPHLPDERPTVEQTLRAAHTILLYRDPDVLLRSARQAIEQERWSEALEALRRVLILEPNSVEALRLRWPIYLELEHPYAALEDLYHLVDVHLLEHRVVESLEAARTAVHLFPGEEKALLKLCFLLARFDQSVELAACGRRLLDLCADHGQHDRRESYQRWLLRQNLPLDDRLEIAAL